MSGGSWEYFTFKLRDQADRLNEDTNPARRAFGKIMTEAAEAFYAIEWHDSGDWNPEQETEAMNKFFNFLREFFSDGYDVAVLDILLDDAEAMVDKLNEVIKRHRRG